MSKNIAMNCGPWRVTAGVLYRSVNVLTKLQNTSVALAIAQTTSRSISSASRSKFVAAPAAFIPNFSLTRNTIPSLAPAGLLIQCQARTLFWSTPKPPSTQPGSDSSISSAVSSTQAPDSTNAVVDPIPSASPVTDSVTSIVGDVLPVIPLDNPQVLGAITQIGDLKTLGLAKMASWPFVTGILEQTMELIYLSTGLPWWGAIALTTVIMRVVMFPPILWAQRAAAKMANIKPAMEAIQAKLSAAKEAGDKKTEMQSVAMLQKLFKDNGVSPLSGLWALVQAPVFIAFYFSLTKMANLPVPGFESGGMLWFKDLAAMDPTGALPIFAAVTMLASMEISARTTGQMASNTMRNVMRVMCFASAWVTMHFPAGVFMYWVTANVISMIQVFALNNPVVRQYLRIPKLRVDPLASTRNTGMAAIKPITVGQARKVVIGAKAARKE
ncbi:60Kd inner membrane protein-domain-containing protein [Cladochytrium replicatum]|nr:60Kd inner membrane protein-domain-containing protein [Cladochytrium replicatum]